MYVALYMWTVIGLRTLNFWLRVKETNMKIIEYQVIMTLFNYFVVYVSNQINSIQLQSNFLTISQLISTVLFLQFSHQLNIKILRKYQSIICYISFLYTYQYVFIIYGQISYSLNQNYCKESSMKNKQCNLGATDTDISAPLIYHFIH